MVENTGIVSTLMMVPSNPDVLAWLTMLFGALKWAFFVVTMRLVGLVKAALNRFRKQTEFARL